MPNVLLKLELLVMKLLTLNSKEVPQQKLKQEIHTQANVLQEVLQRLILQ